MEPELLKFGAELWRQLLVRVVRERDEGDASALEGLRGVELAAIELLPAFGAVQHAPVPGPQLSARVLAQRRDVARPEIVAVDVLACRIVEVDLQRREQPVLAVGVFWERGRHKARQQLGQAWEVLCHLGCLHAEPTKAVHQAEREARDRLAVRRHIGARLHRPVVAQQEQRVSHLLAGRLGDARELLRGAFSLGKGLANLGGLGAAGLVRHHSG